MAKKKKTPGIGSKVSFRDGYGNKHFGVIEDIIPDIMGGSILSVKCNALGKILTISQELISNS